MERTTETTTMQGLLAIAASKLHWAAALLEDASKTTDCNLMRGTTICEIDNIEHALALLATVRRV